MLIKSLSYSQIKYVEVICTIFRRGVTINKLFLLDQLTPNSVYDPHCVLHNFWLCATTMLHLVKITKNFKYFQYRYSSLLGKDSHRELCVATF